MNELQANKRRKALQDYINSKGDRQLNAICKAAGVSESTVRQFLDGKTQSLQMVTYDKLAISEGVPVSVLLGEDGVGRSDAVNHFLSEIRRIDVIGILQAGLFRTAEELPPEERKSLALPANIPYSDHDLGAFKVLGPSMDQFYPDGSYVIVAPSIGLGSGWVPESGQHVIVQRRNSWGEFEATIKEVRYDGDKVMLWPRSNHPDFQKPWELTPEPPSEDAGADGIRITGLVVWFVGRAPRT